MYENRDHDHRVEKQQLSYFLALKKNQCLGAGERSQLLKGLPCKCEDLRLIPSTHVKESRQVVRV